MTEHEIVTRIRNWTNLSPLQFKQLADEIAVKLNEHAKLEAELDKAVAFLEGDDSPLARLEAELLKYRRLDMAWAEEVKEQDLTITNLKEELGHLHSRFDRELDDALAETQEKEVADE